MLNYLLKDANFISHIKKRVLEMELKDFKIIEKISDIRNNSTELSNFFVFKK
jgi:hypothetical protein